MQRALAAVALAAATALAVPAVSSAASEGPVRVVYHVNEGNAQALNALRNMRNHLAADPTAKIVLVAHSAGIDFLLDGALDANGAPFDATVQDLKSKGVEFRVCRFTLERRKIDAKKVIPDASIVPSGVAEVSKLQFKEGFAYLRP